LTDICFKLTFIATFCPLGLLLMWIVDERLLIEILTDCFYGLHITLAVLIVNDVRTQDLAIKALGRTLLVQSTAILRFGGTLRNLKKRTTHAVLCDQICGRTSRNRSRWVSYDLGLLQRQRRYLYIFKYLNVPSFLYLLGPWLCFSLIL
jgi:hypothetical protein